ncbi:MAG: hypothetical protein ACLPHP_03890 [Candidatus Sulfotelmatobacter sp.]
MRLADIILALVVIGSQAYAQAPTTGAPFTYPELGFRYTPPGTLNDFTAADDRYVQERAAALHTTKVLKVRLSLQSSSEDTDQNWHKIGIETYPRANLTGLSDQAAIRKVSRWVAGIGTNEVGEPKEARIGDFHFTISAFELREGHRVKHASVYTTVLKGQVVSFAFSANSPEVVSGIEKSINSIEPVASR